MISYYSIREDQNGTAGDWYRHHSTLCADDYHCATIASLFSHRIICFVSTLLGYRFALVTERLFLSEGISLPLFWMTIVEQLSIGRVWQEEGERNGDVFRFLNGTDLSLQIPLRMTYTTRPSQDLLDQ
uniref:Innexin n=1 Tax=Heterorhabditis bacteriophora TaxID=37862 RepID=A0A1I7WP09_HETBA